jgi:hypothetical protein
VYRSSTPVGWFERVGMDGFTGLLALVGVKPFEPVLAWDA